MALSNHERVGKTLELLKIGLGPFVERQVQQAIKARRIDDAALSQFTEGAHVRKRPVSEWDVAALLKLMWDEWHRVFSRVLGHAQRTFVTELRDHRNRWAHQEPFSSDDAYRALDTTVQLLHSISAPQAAEVDKIRMELLRIRFDEQARGERRKQARLKIRSATSGTLKPWRKIVTPHHDVASGRYQQAEFAADLWQVSEGDGPAEYRDAAEFFRRTYLTESLKGLLAGAVRRLGGQGSDPVVQLQTNFGGGKTHSMLALYHLFSGVDPGEMEGIDEVLRAASAKELPKVNSVVLVGTKIPPGSGLDRDGTLRRTLWGELAWQLGGAAAYARVAADDERGTSPGDKLRQLLVDYGPCLILIDEWVAYARQLNDQGDLPAGSFETQFTFAQALTESVKAVDNCLLVVSLPASDSASSPHAQADDVEVGGQRGREALDRLRNVVSRIESSWRPASAEEGFEIVRRRLFEPFTDPHRYKERDVVARAFANLYRANQEEFPSECRDADYEKRMKAAYPIHPEIFDRLYMDWSTLPTFQRTRGVLRLMAAVIHSLWQKGDQSPLILPSNLSVDDPRVLSELTRYLPDNWAPVIEKDVDGESALPQRLDGDVPNLGKFSACRRVARTVYLGSAPAAGAAQRGIEDRRIKLGCVSPGEPLGVFGDALRRLADRATYLYRDGSRYWYDTRPTVTKLAGELAEQLRSDPDRTAQAIDQRLREALRETGGFSRIHVAPRSGHDVPDERDARLVVLTPEHYHHRGDPDSPAEAAVRAILESRGTSPRLYRNTLVFLAPDQSRLQDLDEAIRRHLAWESIRKERERLDLSPHQLRLAETQRDAAAEAVTARLPETYRWLLTPIQENPADAVSWETTQLSGQSELASRVFRRLERDDLLATRFAGTRLRMELDRVPLWRENHVSVEQLADDFARYLYLPRLLGPEVLARAVANGVGLLSWTKESFAYADRFDEAEGKYIGLRGDQVMDGADIDPKGLVVKPDTARRQLETEKPKLVPIDDDPQLPIDGGTRPPPPSPQPRRFHGTVALDSTRTGADASRIATEVITHLVALVDAKVSVRLEIDADIPNGAPDQVVRTVTENSRTLKFSSHGFERE